MAALKYWDLASGTWKTLAGPAGPVGPQGPQGAQGIQGPAGTPRWRGYYWSGAGPIGTAAPGPTSGVGVVIPETGDYLIHFNGSCYTTTAGVSLFFDLWIDQALAANSTLFFNAASFHSSFPGGAIVKTLTAGTHLFYIRVAGTGVTSDANDRMWFSVI